MLVDIEAKNMIHECLDMIEHEIKDLGAPYRATTKVLASLAIWRDELLEGDNVFTQCEECNASIWESDVDQASSSDDIWTCPDCVERLQASTEGSA